jgi:hypothetical protein
MQGEREVPPLHALKEPLAAEAVSEDVKIVLAGTVL